MKGIVKEYVFVMLIPSHSHGVTFGHMALTGGVDDGYKPKSSMQWYLLANIGIC